MYLFLLGIDKRWSLIPFRVKDRLFLRPLAPGQGLTGEGGLTKIWGFFTGFPWEFPGGFPEGNRVPWSWESPRSGLIKPPTENCRQFLGLADVALLLAVKFNSIQNNTLHKVGKKLTKRPEINATISDTNGSLSMMKPYEKQLLLFSTLCLLNNLA